MDWHSPQHHNQIDYILVKKHCRSGVNIARTRSFPEADIGSDHDLLMMTFRTGDWFRTTVGVRQGCLLSPTLFNIYLERIMTDALEDHEGTVSIGGGTISNLRFADDNDGLAGEEEELANLAEHLD